MTESAPDAAPQPHVSRSDLTDQNMGEALSRVLFGDKPPVEPESDAKHPAVDTEVDRG